MERHFILDYIFTSAIIFKYQIFIINQDETTNLEQCKISQNESSIMHVPEG
jgi:hypothetical protein